MKKYGFYLYLYGKDCFYETKQTRKNKKLAEDFIYTIQFKLGKRCFANDADIEYVQKSMASATFETKTIQNGDFAGLKYYVISGEHFFLTSDVGENPLEDCIVITTKTERN